LIPQNRRGINNMPFLFYLPLIIATGMFSVATEGLNPIARKPQRRERQH
jgi:hypothetical protein